MNHNTIKKWTALLFFVSVTIFCTYGMNNITRPTVLLQTRNCTASDVQAKYMVSSIFFFNFFYGRVDHRDEGKWTATISKVNRNTFVPVFLTYFFEYVTPRQGKRTASIFSVFFFCTRNQSALHNIFFLFTTTKCTAARGFSFFGWWPKRTW